MWPLVLHKAAAIFGGVNVPRPVFVKHDPYIMVPLHKMVLARLWPESRDATCDLDTDSNRARQRPAKRQEPKPCKTKAPFFVTNLLVGSQKPVLKVPKKGQSHVA